MLKLLTVVMPFLFSSAWANVVHIEVDPSTVNVHAQSITGKHGAFWDPTVLSQDLLLISIGGTNSLPTDFRAFDTLAAQMGFDVIAVDYNNRVISTACRPSPDDLCFDHFREEVVTGRAVSDLLEVPRANSIEARIIDMLRYLSAQDRARWGKYIGLHGVTWDKIVVVGHSQGSGHAAYLSKLHALHGVLMFAGPQDSFEDDNRVVGWLHRPGKTSADRYYSFLHEKDFFDARKQARVGRILMGASAKAEQMTISTAENVGDPHMAVIGAHFTPVWEELLRIQIRKK